MPLNDFFKRLFGWPKRSLTCKKIEHSRQFVNAYQDWVNARKYLNWTTLFFKAYHYQKAHFPSPLRVQLIEAQHRNGAVLFYDPGIGEQNFTFLFNLLKDRILQHGYTLHSSDQMVLHHERYTEQVEKHLLLPPASDGAGSDLCNQLYGNVLLDYIKINGHAGYIRLVANTYAAAVFSPPLPFSDLLEEILQPQEK